MKKNKKKIEDRITIDTPESTKTASRIMLTKKIYKYDTENHRLVEV